MFKTSIRNKLIILLLLITIVPFGTSIIITYFHTKQTVKDQLVLENTNLLYQGKINLEEYIKELDGLTLSLYNNPEFMKFLRSSHQDSDKQTVEIIKNVLVTLLYAEDNIERVFISFVDERKTVSVSKRSAVLFSRQVNSLNKEYYIRANDNPYHIYLEPLHIQERNQTLINVEQPKKVFTLHRAFADFPSNRVLAYISIEAVPDRINQLSQNLYNESNNEEFYIISPESKIIYPDNENAQNWVEPLLNMPSESGTMEWKDKSFQGMMIYDQVDSSHGAWTLVKRIPYTTLYESAFSVAKISIIFGLIGLILVIIATLLVSVRITSPIRILLKNIQEVEKGNMEVQFTSLGYDEIGVLGQQFKQMMEKINHLINREYKLELENKTNQLKVLQSQINPHFLYNSFQSIGTEALKNNGQKVYVLLTHLTKIMRYGMTVDEDLVPLNQEINYTNAYLLLQKQRFGDQFEYFLHADEIVSYIYVPKMILQPIVENYFKHGFEAREGIGKVIIFCRKKEDKLFIEIEDNGKGIENERLKEINRNLESDNASPNCVSKNIGLKNVFARLKIYYDGNATLQLINRESGGLLVKIVLPIDVEGKLDESNHSR